MATKQELENEVERLEAKVTELREINAQWRQYEDKLKSQLATLTTRVEATNDEVRHYAKSCGPLREALSDFELQLLLQYVAGAPVATSFMLGPYGPMGRARSEDESAFRQRARAALESALMRRGIVPPPPVVATPAFVSAPTETEKTLVDVVEKK